MWFTEGDCVWRAFNKVRYDVGFFGKIHFRIRLCKCSIYVVKSGNKQQIYYFNPDAFQYNETPVVHLCAARVIFMACPWLLMRISGKQAVLEDHDILSDSRLTKQ